MSLRIATVYLRKETLFVHPDSRTTDGVWVVGSPVVAVPLHSDDAKLGSAVLSALGESKQSVAHPNPSEKVGSELLRAARCSSWRAFERGASVVNVEHGTAGIVLVLNRRLGSRGGFTEMGRRPLSGKPSPEVLGQEVRNALADCT